MIIAKKKFIRFALICSLVLSLAQAAIVNTAKADSALWSKVQSGGLQTIGNDAFDSQGNPTDVRLIVAKIIKVFLGLLGIIFVVIIILAGYKYMTAQGDESKIEEALGQIKTGVIGLVIVLAAYSIAVFVSDRIYKVVTGLNP